MEQVLVQLVMGWNRAEIFAMKVRTIANNAKVNGVQMHVTSFNVHQGMTFLLKKCFFEMINYVKSNQCLRKKVRANESL